MQKILLDSIKDELDLSNTKKLNLFLNTVISNLVYKINSEAGFAITSKVCVDMDKSFELEHVARVTVYLDSEHSKVMAEIVLIPIINSSPDELH